MLRNPFWMSDDTEIRPFKEAPPLDKDEVTFWRELIDSYLTPLEGDQQRQKDLQASLIELRNKVCLIFILVNSLFIIIVFTLQRVTAGGSALSLKLPCANENSDNGGQSVEPISVAFTLVFGLLLLVQFLCMLMHRFATLLHICASTTIFEGKKLLAKFKKDPETGTDDGNSPVEVAISVQAVSFFSSINGPHFSCSKLNMMLSKMLITKALIRLRACAGRSAPVLFSNP